MKEFLSGFNLNKYEKNTFTDTIKKTNIEEKIPKTNNHNHIVESISEITNNNNTGIVENIREVTNNSTRIIENLLLNTNYNNISFFSRNNTFINQQNFNQIFLNRIDFNIPRTRLLNFDNNQIRWIENRIIYNNNNLDNRRFNLNIFRGILDNFHQNIQNNLNFNNLFNNNNINNNNRINELINRIEEINININNNLNNLNNDIQLILNEIQNLSTPTNTPLIIISLLSILGLGYLVYNNSTNNINLPDVIINNNNNNLLSDKIQCGTNIILSTTALLYWKKLLK